MQRAEQTAQFVTTEPTLTVDTKPSPVGSKSGYSGSMQLLVEDVALDRPMVIQWEHQMTDDEYFQFCQINQDLRIERTAQGDLLIMPPAGFESGYRNNELSRQLANWALEDGRGLAFDSNTEYILPKGAAYSPDASWVLQSRLTTLTKEQKRKFPPLCPDFVVELMSPSDRLSKAKAKMEEWIANGAQLGWLLDPDHRTVHIYRPNREPEQVVNAERLVGEGPVAGFTLELADIWTGL
jgi:Uma2 family endonuclease